MRAIWWHVAVLAAMVGLIAWWVTGPLACFGCGGIEFAEGTSPAEQRAAVETMKHATITLVWVSVLSVVMLLAGQIAWTGWIERERDG